MNDPGRVPAGCKALDSFLGGGYERGTVTQLYGPPAAGKTNLVLSAASATAAAGETAVIIDTEGLSGERLQQIINGTEGQDIPSRIKISAAHDFEGQQETIQAIGSQLDNAGLIAVDSITGHYRLERASEAERGETLRELSKQVTFLLSLARKHDLAVIVTNQVYTDPETDRDRPLGGHQLAHWSGTICKLERFRGGKRRLKLEKHRSKPTGESLTIALTDRGIAEVDVAP